MSEDEARLKKSEGEERTKQKPPEKKVGTMLDAELWALWNGVVCFSCSPHQIDHLGVSICLAATLLLAKVGRPKFDEYTS